MRRLLSRYAFEWDVDPAKLAALLDRANDVCEVCSRRMIVPHLYRINGVPTALICGYCEGPIRKAEGSPELLALHSRFNPRRSTGRVKLSRFMRLPMLDNPFDQPSLPANTMCELVEDERSSAHREPGDDTDE